MADLTNSLKEFEKQVATAERIVGNVETLWQLAPNGSDVRQQIGNSELAALYEMVYLTIFGHWENFIEGCLARMVAGQGTATYTPVLAIPPKAPTLTAARHRVLNGRRFLLWYDPPTCIARISALVHGSPLESALDGAQTQLEHYAAVRHAIAHRSQDSLQNFSAAAAALCGVSDSRPGDFLRRQDHTDALNPVRWIRKISTDLRSLASVATS